jgi:hypothetical protein
MPKTYFNKQAQTAIIVVATSALVVVGLVAFFHLRRTTNAEIVSAPARVEITQDNVMSLVLDKGKIYLAEGEKLTALNMTSRYVDELQVSPQKDKFAFVIGGDLYEYNLVPKTVELHIQSDEASDSVIKYLFYSPNGKYIAFNQAKGLKVVDTTNKSIQELEAANSLRPTLWHSNGQFMSESASGEIVKVFALNADGIFDEVYYEGF